MVWSIDWNKMGFYIFYENEVFIVKFKWSDHGEFDL